MKDHLTRLYFLNDYQRFEALVSLPLTGDQKPSHLMNRMLALLLALKAVELFQSRVSSPVNLLTEGLENVQVNAVSTRTCPTPPAKVLLIQIRLLNLHLLLVLAGTTRSMEIKAQNFRKPCSESEN